MQPDQDKDLKTGLHIRNAHRDRYDFATLIASYPTLKQYLSANEYSSNAEQTINFADPEAVLHLNTALLAHFYKIKDWSIPKEYLCPPIPGRAEYIHHAADLLGSNHDGKYPTGPKVRCLDIGTGANCIYPIVGHQVYGWSFVGTEIDPVAIKSAKKILVNNVALSEFVEIRLQPKKEQILAGIISKDEFFDLSICNPPFHSSLEEAQKGTQRKKNNLHGKDAPEAILNFGGQKNELWCNGGELKFIETMIHESKQFGRNICWFTTLVSKSTHLKRITAAIRTAGAQDMKITEMQHGNKISRFVAWTFLNPDQHRAWYKKRL
jgi:23S rRNA (adenine1618-N6)-methyltransferase